MSIYGRIVSALFGHHTSSVAPGTTTTTTTAEPLATVDVTAILDDLAAKAGEPLDWRNSIVDLLKLLGMDSSLQARKALADELDYPGDIGVAESDSAPMNIWLHGQVMTKLAENGGKIPDELRQPTPPPPAAA